MKKTAADSALEPTTHERLRESFPSAGQIRFRPIDSSQRNSSISVVHLDSPGHFIFADECAYSRHVHVGDYCVATVGERHTEISGENIERVGADFYISVVFRLTRFGSPIMPEIEIVNYSSREAADAGHAALFEKYHHLSSTTPALHDPN